MSQSKGILYLLPNTLGQTAHPEYYLPRGLEGLLATLDGLIAESPKGFRNYVKVYENPKIRNIPYDLFNKNTLDRQVDQFLDPILEGENWGVISDCGCPTIADPSYRLVAAANRHGIRVVPLAGPSSIEMAMMLSGFSGQRYQFCGYLPKKEEEKADFFNSLDPTLVYLFIEAPFRNNKTYNELLERLGDQDMLGVFADLTLDSQFVRVSTLGGWKKESPPDLEDRPTIFLVKGGGNFVAKGKGKPADKRGGGKKPRRARR
ncbi:MAG: Ribosomal RNA small subunit methyltransferase I [Chlamydiia bacterium]|nr:Ribosomal RNA small subunit methyltransferase I [Chlamydiia bacterium]